VTPERKAEIEATLEEILGPKPLPKLRVIARQNEGTIRDADVHLSRADLNAHGEAVIVSVRRPDWVTVNMVEYDRHQAEQAAKRRHRRLLDPFKLGLYGPIDDDE